MRTSLEAAKQAATLMKERIRAELGEDEEAMLSAVESETDFHETVAALAREAKRREGYASAVKAIIAENKARQERHERAAEVIREAIAKAMLEIGLSKVEAADLTISARLGPVGVRILSDDMLPDWAWRVKTTKAPDMAVIKSRVLERGEAVAGVVTTNGSPIVTIRTV